MYIPFDQLTHASQIWIYQANRTIAHHERKELHEKTIAFLTTWTTHGAPLRSSGIILHDRFFILATEVYPRITNCAVDTSIRFIQKIEQEFDISLLDRTRIMIKIDGQTHVIPISQVMTSIKEGTIGGDTLFFDNTITRKEALTHRWLVPIKSTWLYNRFKT